MRVIGGAARGRPIRAPRLPELRPTSDRVRESMFDILEARDLVEGATVLDLFAGSGALGIEALSRGAEHVTFVEREPLAVAAITSNLRSAKLPLESANVVRADVMSWLAVRSAGTAASAGAYDLALIDPPYAFADWSGLLDLVSAPTLLIEHRSALDLGARRETIRQYRYGGTLVTLAMTSMTGMSGRADTTDEDPA